MSRVLPILFNTDMVKAILDGRKTVTRRLVKHDVNAILNSPYHKEHPEVEDKQIISKLCLPPYQQGDILYVRETWSDHYVPDEEGKAKLEYCYKADGTDIKGECLPGENNRWYPSIHMPKEAARIWLKVIDVRVERLQEIDDEQAKAEGANWKNGKNVGFEEKMRHSAVERFVEIWNSTIKKSDLERYGWNANPWVWVIEFENIEKEQVYER